MLKTNEGKTCDAIIRFIEKREGKQRSNFIDLAKDQNAPELMVDVGVTTYVMEHTVVEPFAGHIQLNNQAEQHIQPIIDQLTGALPPQCFELHIPAKIFQGRKMPEIKLIQDALVAWVKQVALTLPIRSYASYIGNVVPVRPRGVPFDVFLYRFDPMHTSGFFHIVHMVDGNRDAPREARINVAIDKKFPKLAQWKKDKKARSILVLEVNDNQLSNQSVVAEAYVPLAKARTDCPDETHLVFTCIKPWHYWPVLIDGKSYFELSGDEMFGWELDEASLTQLTKR